MVDTDTILTVLYVMADDFCKCQSRSEGTPGLRASLTGSEVVNPMCKFYHASSLSNWSGGFPCS